MTPEVQSILGYLERRGTKKNREGMARYGIVAEHVFGVSVADLQKLAKTYGRNHELALELWDTCWYEARMLTAFVDEPSKVTSTQMDRWARDFENWAICDTMCFHLFDRTKHAWKKVHAWSTRKPEFVKRAAFATLAGLSLHNKDAPTGLFLNTFPLIERAALDERNYVKKGVSWALRTVGRRNPELHENAVRLAASLVRSESASARWIGRDAYRELTSDKVRKSVEKRATRR